MNGAELGNKNDLSSNNLIRSANNQVLIDVLSPQVIENEVKKREHKDALLEIMREFTKAQFRFTSFFVAGVCFFVLLGGAFDWYSEDMVKLIFTFVGTYITSIVVELIAILNYIAKKVFDTSVADLLAMFKASEGKKE